MGERAIEGNVLSHGPRPFAPSPFRPFAFVGVLQRVYDLFSRIECLITPKCSGFSSPGMGSCLLWAAAMLTILKIYETERIVFLRLLPSMFLRRAAGLLARCRMIG